VVIEYLVFDANASPPFLRLGTASAGELLSMLRLMSSIAIGQRYKFDLVAECDILGSEASRAEVTIVGMCAEGDDTHRFVLVPWRIRREKHYRQSAQERRHTSPGQS
jgi:hypothetical protein